MDKKNLSDAGQNLEKLLAFLPAPLLLAAALNCRWHDFIGTFVGPAMRAHKRRNTLLQEGLLFQYLSTATRLPFLL